MRAMENDPRQKQPGEKFMVKELSEKLNKKYGSKIAWNADEYVEYIRDVRSARIEYLYRLINEFNDWAILSEEEDHLDKIKKDLKNYLKLLYKINAELNSYLEYLGE